MGLGILIAGGVTAYSGLSIFKNQLSRKKSAKTQAKPLPIPVDPVPIVPIKQPVLAIGSSGTLSTLADTGEKVASAFKEIIPNEQIAEHPQKTQEGRASLEELRKTDGLPPKKDTLFIDSSSRERRITTAMLEWVYSQTVVKRIEEN